VALDYFTKWVEALPTKHADVATLLKMIKDILLPRFGVPKILITDGGSHFIQRIFGRVLCKYKVTHRIASPYHPQTSGQVELSNREIKMILQKTVQKSRKDWASKLNEKLWAYRTAYKNPMVMSPYNMLYGKACHLPLELEHKAFWAIKNINFNLKEAGEKRLLDMHALDELHNSAYESARLFKEKVKMWHDRKILKRTFTVGDKVLLFNSCLKLFPGKLRSRWDGPYEIEEVYNSRAIHLKGGKNGPWIVNGQRLKIYLADEQERNIEEVSFLTIEQAEALRKGQ
jgi:transposase InsO family protein